MIGSENMLVKQVDANIKAKVNTIFRVKPRFDMTKKSSTIFVSKSGMAIT